MKAFVIEYEGVYLGGSAVVIAETPERAAHVLRGGNLRLPRQCGEFRLCDITEISLDREHIAFNDDGDY